VQKDARKLGFVASHPAVLIKTPSSTIAGDPGISQPWHIACLRPDLVHIFHNQNHRSDRTVCKSSLSGFEDKLIECSHFLSSSEGRLCAQSSAFEFAVSGPN